MYFENNTVAVLVATSDRPALLGRRALPSIASQSRSPSRVVIVDDSGRDTAAARTERIVRDWRPADISVDFLRNRRTKGASGAWNSGLDHLLRTCGDPRRIHVAILDDDDRWDPRHLERCLAAVERHGLDMVAAPFWRTGEAAELCLEAPPPSLDIADFLSGNPGIQGSNMVVRLSALLEAGMFDESLPSCTDRDLCIRLAELPGLRYRTTSEPTVHHFACGSRKRLSTPGSSAKTTGLDRFFGKYGSRMSETEGAAFRARAGQYFGWTETAPGPAVDDGMSGSAAPSPLRAPAPLQAPPHLVVGAIADTARLEQVGNLLADLRGLAEEPGLSGHDVLILENGLGRAADRTLRDLVERERAEGLRIHLVDRARHLEDAGNGLVPDGGAGRGGRLSISPARTVLQSYLYAFAKSRPGSIVWIVDDDMRLDPLVMDGDGRLRRRSRNLAPVLRELRRLHAAGAVDIAIGAYTGAPPLPFAATVRVQLVDLAASLRWLTVLDPGSALPDRGPENAALRSGRHDYYYDLSRNETDRLETPFWITPEFPGETAGKAFSRMACSAERILAGEQVFRPLAVRSDIDPLSPVGDGLQRGGNTFILDIEALRLAPNPSPAIDGRPSRRSDMIWALLQERYFGRKVASLPIALYHDRAGLPVGGLDVERIVDDIRGYAAFRALQETPELFLVSDDQRLEPVEAMLGRFAERARKFLDERLAAFRLSFHRIRGLAGILAQLAEDDGHWWRADEYRPALDRLRAFSGRLADVYTLETLHRIEHEAGALTDRQVREFPGQLLTGIEDHRNRLKEPAALLRGLPDERVANARAIAGKLAAPAGPLALLGCGMEGVALADGERVYKVFDYWWKPSHVIEAPALLRTLVGAWSDTRCLYPLLALHESGHRAVLVYPFEASEPYCGGHGPGIVELLAECRRHGIVCRNIHPDNLRVVDGRVRLIDYGSDIRLLEGEADFEAMCRRAWLSCRWANRPDLADIMKRALNDSEIPELDGFDRFHEAVRRVTGRHETSPDIALGMVGTAGYVLDYGCGKGRLAEEMANRGIRVLGYDPDRAHGRRWEVLCRKAGNLRFTRKRDEALAAGPFDLVVCRRVLCTVEDDAELRVILSDLRASVADQGQVVVTVCDPHFTFGGPSPEADRELPSGTRYEDTFTWRKRVRATGRVRRDVHRPEAALRREFARAGLAVRRRVEEPSVDLERFEPMSEQLAFELRPLAPLPGEVTLLIKACAMEATTLDVQVRHLVSQLEGPRAFAERVLVIDSREDGFLRQHARGSLSSLRRKARRLKNSGWIDRIVEGPGDGPAAAALNRRWFGIPSTHSHAATGAQLSSTLAGFEACGTRYVLHVDADVMVARMDRDHDYMAEMLAVLTGEPDALTVALNIAMEHARPYARPYTDRGACGAWRTEARAGMIDLAWLRRARPLPNRSEGGRLALPWHRALDWAIEKGAGRSFRGGDRRTFHVHPPNARKSDIAGWFAALDRIEHGEVPRVQTGSADWTGGIAEWTGPRRREPFVFVVSGRNVSPGRFRRCLESMTRQKGPRWGAVIFDDASDPEFAEHFEIACGSLGEHCTVIRNRRRRGLLANMVTAIRTICTDGETVIVTLDADDALIGDRVLKRLAAEYERGADMTVGSMLRTDKAADYPVCFERPREHRGGNVWQHLRSFRKRLFDAIPDEALRLDGEYADLAGDWAFMLPIVEMAGNPVHIPEPLYLYEPSGVGKGIGRVAREETIRRIVARETAKVGTTVRHEPHQENC